MGFLNLADVNGVRDVVQYNNWNNYWGNFGFNNGAGAFPFGVASPRGNIRDGSAQNSATLSFDSLGYPQGGEETIPGSSALVHPNLEAANPPAWQANTTYWIDDYVLDNASPANAWVARCIGSTCQGGSTNYQLLRGTSGSSTPGWTNVKAVSDGVRCDATAHPNLIGCSYGDTVTDGSGATQITWELAIRHWRTLKAVKSGILGLAQ
jgi:hypothetical protein